ncbi:zinc-binding dehydrogenase [Pinibacter soli]|uniref:alcohol dehydrogenase n=1 Tax=Pinibacter soli TaxID=3044211 RepID=A0ABT6RF86_9BACT|nr:zinc-binding dehydrogenase [Pinibacter soli]MDI3321233.1 zinc-binding dehydrogenase [Pinibacter soli]
MNQDLLSFPPGKVAVFNGHGQPFSISTHDVPFIKTGEVLVKTLYTTLCGSDIHTYCGRRQEPPNVVLGHEVVGEIAWIDPQHSGKDINGAAIQPGDRITWSIFSVPPGIVPPHPDMPQKSEQLFKYGHALAKEDDVFNGGLADYCVLRANTAIIKISNDVPLKVAATINCAHATVMGALRIAGKIENRKVLVLGAGMLGLACLAMCKEAGASWIGLVDRDNGRLQWGEKFGASKSYHLDEKTEENELPWPEADIVFDMSGSPRAMEMGMDSLALGGAAIWIGAVFPDAPVKVDAQKVVRKLLQIRGLHNYNYDDLVKATEFIERSHSKYPFAELVEKEYNIEAVEDAFAFASEQKPVRVGVRVNAGL